MPRIEHLTALEILDSRGRPTLAATCSLAGGAVASASVPSGASTGTHEAVELRDADPSRYRGLGCRKAVANIIGPIADALRGSSFDHQSELDRKLISLDGTESKSRLGANAILAVSIAFARACSVERGAPLYQHFADMLGQAPRLPRLTINLFSGGKHAGSQVPIQDVLIVPTSATSVDQSLADAFAVYQSAAELSLRKYGMRALTADEGGLAPPFTDVETMLADAVESIDSAGCAPRVKLAVDVASSHFYCDGRYEIARPGRSSSEMIQLLKSWTQRFPIISIEDGLAEDDWTHWPQLKTTIGSTCLVLGDDLLCTNAARIRRAIDSNAASALLLKVNQVGTLTEAQAALELARSAGWKVVISARSGETEDTWLADLATGWSADYIKVGSITQSERLAKYNRLLAIEAETRMALAPE